MDIIPNWWQQTGSLACADCHMPYMRQGGLKISDHPGQQPAAQDQSFLRDLSSLSRRGVEGRVEDIQDRFFNLRNTALDALVDLINDIKTEKAKGATDAQLAAARGYQRKGQFMIDFVMSENSMGFHAPQEATRILGDAINQCRLGQLTLHGAPPPSHNPSNIVELFPGRAASVSQTNAATAEACDGGASCRALAAAASAMRHYGS
jgi:nitrite reductase (cytochrome c-552)